MKNKKLWWRIICICVLLIPLFSMAISADVGNIFSGGDSGGSSGSSGGGIDLGLIFLLTRSPIGVVVLIILVIGVIYSNAKKGNGGASTFHDTGFKRVQGIDEEDIIRRVQEHDQNFSDEEFKAHVSEVWITLQRAWETKSWRQVRPFETDALFKLHQTQLQEYIDNDQTNYMKKQNVQNIMITNFERDTKFETIVIKLDASLLDYTKDDATGKIIDGSDTHFVHRSYRLEFIRKTGILTENQKEIAITNCPNCGAPTQITSSGQCEYCDSVITNGNYGWVLNRYAAWN